MSRTNHLQFQRVLVPFGMRRFIRSSGRCQHAISVAFRIMDCKLNELEEWVSLLDTREGSTTIFEHPSRQTLKSARKHNRFDVMRRNVSGMHLLIDHKMICGSFAWGLAAPARQVFLCNHRFIDGFFLIKAINRHRETSAGICPCQDLSIVD